MQNSCQNYCSYIIIFSVLESRQDINTHFNPEDTGSIFLWNVGIYPQENILQQPRRSQSELILLYVCVYEYICMNRSHNINDVFQFQSPFLSIQSSFHSSVCRCILNSLHPSISLSSSFLVTSTAALLLPLRKPQILHRMIPAFEWNNDKHF